VACSHRADDVAALRRQLAAARRALPPPAHDLWGEEGPQIPMTEKDVVEVLGGDMGIPELPLLWDASKRPEDEKLRRWLRTPWLHRPEKSHDGDPSLVRFAIVYRPSKVLLPRHVDAHRNDGGEIVSDVTVVDLGRAKAICGAPVDATNGAHLSFPIGGPTGMTPQEALEVDLRRNLRERARMTLAGVPRCRGLPILP
jgi:hypothetical protein